jgi:Ca2+:H+ antiporter
MPIVYVCGLFFSLKTHKYIYEQMDEHHEASGPAFPTLWCIGILAVACTAFSIVCEILTDKLELALSVMGLTERFVGLVFYTLIPAVAEFINTIRFALEDNLGLSLEIGNQGAMVVSLIQIPALVLISMLLHKKGPSRGQFTLMFEMIDVYAVIIAVLLRNQLLMDKSINWFTGFAFLVIFFFIAIVYYFDAF